MENKNLYITVMFPYPSGDGLHCGHWYNYAIIDSYCRYQCFIGNNVFQPFGYDSFGLPAENYAKKVGKEVEKVPVQKVKKLTRKEMDELGGKIVKFMQTDLNISKEELLKVNRRAWLLLREL